MSIEATAERHVADRDEEVIREMAQAAGLVGGDLEEAVIDAVQALHDYCKGRVSTEAVR